MHMTPSAHAPHGTQIRQGLNRTFGRKRNRVAITAGPPLILDYYYNLNPNVAHLSGLNPAILPKGIWVRFSEFCAAKGILQEDLERVYYRFAYTIESNERILSSNDRIEHARKVGWNC